MNNQNIIKPGMNSESKARFIEQNLHSEVIGDFSQYFNSSVPIDFKDFTAIPGVLKSINGNKTQQFDVTFSVPHKHRLEYYNCFKEFRYSWGHTIHVECLTLVKISLSDITDEDLHEIQIIEDVFEPGEDCSLHIEPEFNSCYFKNEWDGGSFKRPLLVQSYQYLQSKGYALPWMGYSVEDMVQAGWIKLKGGQNV